MFKNVVVAISVLVICLVSVSSVNAQLTDLENDEIARHYLATKIVVEIGIVREISDEIGEIAAKSYDKDSLEYAAIYHETVMAFLLSPQRDIFEEEYILFIAGNYTEKQLHDLLRFASTDVGKATLRENPLFDEDHVLYKTLLRLIEVGCESASERVNQRFIEEGIR